MQKKKTASLSVDCAKNAIEVSFYCVWKVQYTELKSVKSQAFHALCAVREFKIHSFLYPSKAYLSEKAADRSD